LSELGVIRSRETHSVKAKASDLSPALPPKQRARAGSRLVRPPRSC
jgi:hypothetical protein